MQATALAGARLAQRRRQVLRLDGQRPCKPLFRAYAAVRDASISSLLGSDGLTWTHPI